MNAEDFRRMVRTRDATPVTVGFLISLLQGLVTDGTCDVGTRVVVEGCDCTDDARGIRVGLNTSDDYDHPTIEVTILADGRQYEDGVFYGPAEGGSGTVR